MEKLRADRILQEIETGYDLMSDKFSETRKYFWRGLESISDCAKDGDNILDFGCGNGRLLELFSEKNIKYWGVDVSQKLINLAQQRYCGENIHFSKVDPSQTSLPFQDNFFNASYSIAVFHHFPGKEYRKAMAEEFYRVTEPGGYVIITVWNLWQKKYIGKILKNWKTKILGKNFIDWNDCYITFKDNQGNVFKRYHHAFTVRELENLFAGAGFKKEKIMRGRNIVYIGKKA